MKYVSPSIKETAFNCPHCGALAKQFWSATFVSPHDEKMPLPTIIDDKRKTEVDPSEILDLDERQKFIVWLNRMVSGEPFVEERERSFNTKHQLRNCSVSNCFNCQKSCIWIFDKLMYPVVGNILPANADMPEDIKRDYEEAGSILNQSPRGAAALLRLGIQKLCKKLGQPGENINDDIKALVAAGLDPRVQQSLDAVRVIGNSAVHPGKIDLRDDRTTAEALFRLLNVIVDKTISEPKHVKEIYDSLPANLLEAIAKRDAPKAG
ncbi:DUF4145 domain-containing protein [Pseudomonas atacamensis]|uniref:DUF4145 domain-containing protein n=1 Tax=Pseudomonas atacamensis TaxID=2565368 RepID=UPI002B46E102|nr:DUF4145 domain-containing protein [Pseudomonas atacamensis]MEB2854082.1 DUF4145 domain-containing protein [Pseudomonas atacamensis]